MSSKTEEASVRSHADLRLLDWPPQPGGELPCQSEGVADLFFAEFPREIGQAKHLCAGCPVRAACLDAALEREEPWGVWGGELLMDGVIVANKRGRGRPRKAEVAA